jgi:hypothetical protein
VCHRCALGSPLHTREGKRRGVHDGSAGAGAREAVLAAEARKEGGRRLWAAGPLPLPSAGAARQDMTLRSEERGR